MAFDVVVPHVFPVGLNEITVPLIKFEDAHFVVAQGRQKVITVLSVLQVFGVFPPAMGRPIAPNDQTGAAG